MNERNLKERLEKVSREHPEGVAIKNKRSGAWEDITFSELRGGIKALTSFLAGEGIGKGDKIAIMLENSPEWPVIFFAAVFLGTVLVPVSVTSADEETANILKDSGAKLMFAGERFIGTAKKMVSVCAELDKAVLAGPDLWRDRTGHAAEGSREKEITKDDPACILYTSGTTSEPKGVMLTHGNLLANCSSLDKLGIVREGDRVVSILPLHHTYPLTVTMLFPLLHGRTVIYPGTMRTEEVLRAMREAQASVFIAVPQFFDLFHQRIKEGLKKIPFPLNIPVNLIIGLSFNIRKKTGVNPARLFLRGIHGKFGKKMRVFGSGGARLDENVAKDLYKFGFTVLEGYGLTETSPVLTFNPPEKPKFGSVGIAVPGVEIKIENKNEEGVGEVLARGANVMKGYYKRKDLTDEVIKDGWFHTGDLGYIDEDGYLFLTGRLKEVIVLSSGKNIYPEEVEGAYSAHAPVKEMCVFEAPSAKAGEEASVLWAVVVPDLEFFKKYGEVNLENVIKERFDNVSRTLPPHKRIMGFTIILEDLPRTLLGKIKRFAVEDLYASRASEQKPSGEKKLSDEDLELMEGEVYKRIAGYLEKQAPPGKTVTPADLLELDLGIDSLGRIELAAGLEKILGIEIEDEIIGKAFTVRDLVRDIEPLLAPGIALPEKQASFTAVNWKETFKVLPQKENLEKIDLNPAFGAWLVGFVFTCLNKAFFKMLYGLKAEGGENLPEKGPYIIYVNHTSYYDGLIVASSLPRFPRLDLFFVGFRPYFSVPVIRNLIKVGRIIPLDFSSHFLEALRSCYYVLSNGKNLCLFPEGLRTLDGRIGPFKKGFGILAKETGAKLVPLLIEGAFEAWPRTSRFPGLHPVKVRFGEALDAGELEKEGLEAGAKDSYEAICVAARKHLVDMKGGE